MAEFDSAERVSTYLEEYDTDVMTGDRDKECISIISWSTV